MIQLTEEQRQELQGPEPTAIDPATNREYVLVPKEVYERLKEFYDDSPWTAEEMDALAEEAGKLLDRYEP